jgi:hypothetical protein
MFLLGFGEGYSNIILRSLFSRLINEFFFTKGFLIQASNETIMPYHFILIFFPLGLRSFSGIYTQIGFSS